jgi:hypothetical protein
MFSLVMVSASDYNLNSNSITLRSPDTSKVITLTPTNTSILSSYEIDTSMFDIKDMDGNSIPLTVIASDLTDINSSQEINVTLDVDYTKIQLGRTYSSSFKISDSEGNFSKMVNVAIEESFCIDGAKDDGELKIDVDLDNVKGFGEEDDEWYPLDEIEITVDVDNKWSDTIDDIVIEWCLYSVTDDECILDDEENDFNLKEDKDETVVIEIQIDPDDLDKDSNDYKLYVKVYSDDSSEFGEEVMCIEHIEDVSIIVDDHFAIFDEPAYTESIPCEGFFDWSAELWNIGDSDEEDVYVIFYNKELDINEEVIVGDIDALENKDITYEFAIPEGTAEGTYFLEAMIYDEDDDIFENDEDEEAKFRYPFIVEGNCEVETLSTRISASLDDETPEAIPGEKLLVNADIINTGDIEVNYIVSVSGNSVWSNLDSITPKSFTLGAGESKEVVIALDILKDATGEQEFTINADYNGETTMQKVSIAISEEAKVAPQYGKVVDHIKVNWFIYLIILVNIILIIAIIAVIRRMTRPKPASSM